MSPEDEELFRTIGKGAITDDKMACTHPPGCTFCAWCGLDTRNVNERLAMQNEQNKRSAEIGDYPYVPRKWSLEDRIRDQYFPPGTRFTLTADIRLDERGGIVVLATTFQVVSTGTVIDPAP